MSQNTTETKAIEAFFRKRVMIGPGGRKSPEMGTHYPQRTLFS
jgi:hypothetical protein